MAPSAVRIHDAATATLDPVTLYQILAVRAAVFVVEQDCVYADVDGRDLEDGCRQVWAEREQKVLAVLRVLPEGPGTVRIGRVATVRSARRQGLAGLLLRHALSLVAEDVAVVLSAQSHVAPWYAQFGFVRNGPDFVEDGIAHTPMRHAGGGGNPGGGNPGGEQPRR